MGKPVFVCAHGAGGSKDDKAMLRVAAALGPLLEVVRFNFPYREAGSKRIDPMAVLKASLVSQAEKARAGPLIIGGRSMGGRMCSMAVAGATGNTAKGSDPREEPLPAAGLLLVAYPLHPPGKPDRLRTEHLPDISVPSLFVSGDRDPFGTPEELAAATAAIAGPVTTVTVPGRGHDLKGADDVVRGAVRSWLGLQG